MLLRLAENVNCETRASTVTIFSRERSAVRLDDAARNGQSHSQALFLGGKEPVEQAFVHFSGNSCAMIANAQAHFAVAITGRANLYLASPGGVCRMASKALLIRLTRTC